MQKEAIAPVTCLGFSLQRMKRAKRERYATIILSVRRAR
jgi:hypothetical protein